MNDLFLTGLLSLDRSDDRRYESELAESEDLLGWGQDSAQASVAGHSSHEDASARLLAHCENLLHWDDPGRDGTTQS